MASKYLLPCQCGAKVPVESGQAGQAVVCGCGATLAVPTMREMARLERAEEAGKITGAPEWSVLQGVLFSTGLLVLAGSLLAAAFFGYNWAGVPTNVSAANAEVEEWAAEKMASATPLETLEIWSEIESEGLGHWHPPPQIVLREISANLFRNLLYSLTAAVAGAALAVSSFFLKSRSG